MSTRLLFTLVAAAALALGSALWWLARPQGEVPRPATRSDLGIAPAALLAAVFTDPEGQPHSLGEFHGHVLVVNFWATWCAPCREEMPAFSRLNAAFKDRGVRFVGIANDDPAKVRSFATDLAIGYPVWVGGDAVSDVSRRLGNPTGVLPHTVLINRDGRIVEARVGPYTEVELAGKLENLAGKSGELRR